MSDHLPRRKREQRAYRLTLATGTSAVASVVVLVLTIAGVTSFVLLFLLVVLTAALAWGLKSTLGR
jgi:fatty acid desaturase